MRRLMPAIWCLAAAALVGTALASCSSTPEAAEDEQLTDLRNTVLAHEELIAACMKQAGFDYVAVIPADVLMEEAHWLAEQNGEDPEAAVGALNLPEDPNTKITDGLSPTELKAYEKAFWGTESDGSVSDGNNDGCYYSTYEEAWGVDIVAMAPEFAESVQDANQRIEADPGVIQAKEDLLRCMTAKGYELDTFDDTQYYRVKSEEQMATEIRDAGFKDISTDNPIFVRWESEMAAYDSAFSECEESYLEIVEPIENRYLGN